MATKKISPEFERTHEFISTFSVLDPDELNIAAVWAMGTWCFSPACRWPYTFPYLYVTGAAGSGKSVFGMDVMGAICRNHHNATGSTGPTLFRTLGSYNEETGEIENYAPTLALDEIDATFSGQKDEQLRQALNVGYKQSGSTIPRASGKTTIDFPVYGPKLMLGIDNGHLPETVASRSIRMDLRKHSQDELEALHVRAFLPWEVDEEAAELCESLAQWAKANSMVLRDYNPQSPRDLAARQWEIGRTLIQLAHAIGNEQQIMRSLIAVLTRNPERPDAKVTLYQSINKLYVEHDTDRLTSRQILARLTRDGIRVPGQSGKGLAAALSEDGIAPDLIHLPEGHPGIEPDPIRARKAAGKGNKQRGYYRHKFDGAFVRYLEDEDF